ncbi:MAG: hypothetical protein F6K22_27500 [Okeania sp. SIO2F4]|uniref:hypothetical protein n=1 Tax=Okeania sp. SIO2F4 TaxID=2607790 RepID=UPI0014298F86|nr:hypothetical protein [Okeania sp. SIO2F4]NES06227.1 hypothetical protein [Okeania sp. SIO2F4]
MESEKIAALLRELNQHLSRIEQHTFWISLLLTIAFAAVVASWGWIWFIGLVKNVR